MNRLLPNVIPIKFLNCGGFRNLFLNYEFSSLVTKSSFNNKYFHSSCYQLNEIQTEDISAGMIQKSVRLSAAEARRKAYNTVDWLPFPWTRRPLHNVFEDSGDLVKVLEYDPSWPKPDFEFSDELKTASDDIKYRYSLATASQSEIKEAIKRRWLKKIQRHPNDFNSLEVKVAEYTLRVRALFEHAKKMKKERRGGRRILYTLINRRNRFLKLIYRTDIDRFNWICKELKLEYKPQPLGGLKERERYTKKWDLRRLTKEYCAKMIKDKKLAYHEELKKQQTDFLKEKEEALTWMENEKNEIARITEEIAVTTKEIESLNLK